MVDIHGPWLLMLLAFCFVVGVSMWIGYLLGRVRTLDPRGQRLASEPSAGAPLLFGLVLLVLAGVFAFPTVMDGWPNRIDGPGVFLLICALFLMGFGVAYIGRAVRIDRERR